MNTEAILSGIATVAFVALLVVLHKARKVRAQEQGPDVGVAVFDVDQDINAPSIAVIDDALRQVGDNRDAQDWLLDRRLAAKRGEVSWPSI